MSAIFHGSQDMPILKGSHPASKIVSDATVVSHNASATTPTTPITAAKRLEESRARLRNAMTTSRRQVALSDGAAGPTWLTRLENLPGVRTLVDALKSWWSRHPLRPVVTLAHHTTDAIATPVAQTHPIAMVSAGVVLGALLVAVRPWRWILKRALFAGLVPQLVASLPIDSLLGRLRVAEPRQTRTRSRTADVRGENLRREPQSRVVH